MIAYYLLMHLVAGGRSEPVMVFTYESACEVSRVANRTDYFCLKVMGPKS